LKLPYIKNKRVFYKDWLNKISKYQTSFWGGTVVLDEDKKKKIFSESFKAKTLEFDVYKNIELLFSKFTNAGNNDFLDWMTYLDTNIRLPELLLSRLDRMTMAASVEAREPFMDYRLAEFAMQIDSSLKIKNRTEKYILKKSLEGILDPEIIYREKDGFTVPLNQIFANEKFRKFASTKINDFNDYENIFTPGYLHSIFENNKYSEIWQLMNLALWWENYIIGTSHYINEEGNIKPSFTN
jgi:asparagine synthase (glutamine-hydrolysing)